MRLPLFFFLYRILLQLGRTHGAQANYTAFFNLLCEVLFQTVLVWVCENMSENQKW